MMQFPRTPLARVNCPTLPLYSSGQQVTACSEPGASLSSSIPLPSGLSISGGQLILSPGLFVSRISQQDADAQAAQYLGTFFSSGIASGSLICLGDPPFLTDLCAWWKADSFQLPNNTVVCEAGVTPWKDQVGTRDMTQASAVSRPLFQTNVAGGRPALFFDGVNDAIVFSPDFNFTGGGNGFTVIFIYKKSAADDQGMLLGAQGLQEQIWDRGALNVMRAFDQGINFTSGALSPNSTNLTFMAFRNKQFVPGQMFRQNKTNLGPFTQSNIGFVWNMVGVNFAIGAGPHFHGYLFEVLFYCNFLDDSQLNLVYDSYGKIKYTPLP